jgi:hypothetical protein
MFNSRIRCNFTEIIKIIKERKEIKIVLIFRFFTKTHPQLPCSKRDELFDIGKYCYDMVESRGAPGNYHYLALCVCVS